MTDWLQPTLQLTISAAPDTPFKLATFQSSGDERVGLVLGERILDTVAFFVSTVTADKGCDS